MAKLMTLLPGTLQLGIGTAIDSINHFRNNFHYLMDEVMSDGGGYYEGNDIFTQTEYVPDMLQAIAVALDNTIRKKEKALGIPQLNITIDARERQDLAYELPLISDTVGITGPISFTKGGRRKTVIFDVRNFAPVSDQMSNVSWELFTPLVVMRSSNETRFMFYDRSGGQSLSSTIIFADGTTNSPPYKPQRRYKRSKKFKVTHFSFC